MAETMERSRTENVMHLHPSEEGRQELPATPAQTQSVHLEQNGAGRDYSFQGERREPAPKRTLSTEESREPRQKRRLTESEPPSDTDESDARIGASPYFFAHHNRSAFSPVDGKTSVSPSVAFMPPPPPVPPSSPAQVSSEAMAAKHDAKRSRAELGVDDAMHFIGQVKETLHGSPRVYSEFLGIMKQYRLEEIDTPTVIDCMSRLFRGKPKLIRGFNIFLPKGFQINVDDNSLPEGTANRCATPMSTLAAMASVQPVASDSSQVQQVGTSNEILTPPSPPQSANPSVSFSLPPTVHSRREIDHAVSFVQRVEQRFSSKESRGTYHQFIAILRKFQAKELGLELVASQVSVLFADHPDLIQAFVHFLPVKLREKAQEHLRTASTSPRQVAHAYFGQCIVCKGRAKTHTFVPCGHLCVCGPCASRYMMGSRSCPVCLRRASGVTRILLT